MTKARTIEQEQTPIKIPSVVSGGRINMSTAHPMTQLDINEEYDDEERDKSTKEMCMAFANFIYRKVQAITRVDLPLYYEGEKYFLSHCTFMIAVVLWIAIVLILVLVLG